MDPGPDAGNAVLPGLRKREGGALQECMVGLGIIIVSLISDTTLAPTTGDFPSVVFSGISAEHWACA